LTIKIWLVQKQRVNVTPKHPENQIKKKWRKETKPKKERERKPKKKKNTTPKDNTDQCTAGRPGKRKKHQNFKFRLGKGGMVQKRGGKTKWGPKGLHTGRKDRKIVLIKKIGGDRGDWFLSPGEEWKREKKGKKFFSGVKKVGQRERQRMDRKNRVVKKSLGRGCTGREEKTRGGVKKRERVEET